MGYRVVIGDDESIIRMDLSEMLEEADAAAAAGFDHP